MKVKFVITLIVIVLFSLVIFIIQSEEVDFKPLEIEELETEIQNTINEINASGIYFILKDQNIILYSNLQKSGLYTYPYVEIKKGNNKLIVKIKSQMASNDDQVKELLIGRIELKKLPKGIVSYFLDQRIESQIIDLNE